MRYLILLLVFIVFGCVSSPRIEGPSLTVEELAGVLEAFEFNCSCGESKATLIVSCVDNKPLSKERECYKVFMDDHHPIKGKTDELPLHCSVRKINEKYTGTRMAQENGNQITIVSGCVR